MDAELQQTLEEFNHVCDDAIIDFENLETQLEVEDVVLVSVETAASDTEPEDGLGFNDSHFLQLDREVEESESLVKIEEEAPVDKSESLVKVKEEAPGPHVIQK